jgi:MscS family membrane protein
MHIPLQKAANESTLTSHKTPGGRQSRLIVMVLWLFSCSVLIALGQEATHPLKPQDRSSPRAALKTFLESGDALGKFLVQEYIPAPSQAKFQRLTSLADIMLKGLDLSEVPPAARAKGGRSAVLALYETLNRIELPPFAEIPGGDLSPLPASTNATRWVIPNTEIALERVSRGPHTGEFLFSTDTVANARDFYERVSGLAYIRAVPLQNITEIAINGGGWLIPVSWIQAMPIWLHAPLAEQATWKWIALTLLLGLFALLLRVAYRFSHRGSPDRPFRQALAQLTLPMSILVGTPVFAYLALVQINLIGGVASAVELAMAAVKYFAGAWVLWRVAPVVAEAVIASPRISPQSIDAHLIRICTRLLGIVGAACLLGVGADRVGIPVYGIVAGLGVGGLAIALAAQSSIENLIGGLNLFADKPIRVGDFCMYGTEVGTVEAIGIRSTRIRGLDRTLTTIPNALLSKMPVVNFTVRDRMLLKSIIGLRFETKPEQLRFVLAKLRELLLAHPKVTPEPARVRFIGFGASSVNLEVFAYVGTRDWNEFLGIQEDIYLRMMEVVAASGTGFAFPSQTLYFARDAGLDPDKSAAAMAEVQQWRAAHKLPFPDFDIEFRKMRRDTLDYPPAGSFPSAPNLPD